MNIPARDLLMHLNSMTVTQLRNALNLFFNLGDELSVGEWASATDENWRVYSFTSTLPEACGTEVF